MLFKLQRLVFLSLTAALGIATQAQAQSDSGVAISPGIYHIMTNTNLCVVATRAAGLVLFDFLAQRPCSEPPTGDPTTTMEGTEFAIEPTGQNHFRIRLATGGLCATVARGVVFGYPRINLHPCDGNVDQEFGIGPSADISSQSLFIHTEQRPGSNFVVDFQCWAVRGNGREVGIDIIQSPCTGSSAAGYFHLTRLRG